MVVLPPTGEPEEYNCNYIFYWNSVALDLIRLTTTVKGPLRDPPGSSRALAILHLSVNDAYFAIRPDPKVFSSTYLTPNNTNPALRLPKLNGANDPKQAVAGAAITVLTVLFTEPAEAIATASTNTLSTFLQQQIVGFHGIDMDSASFHFGVAIGATLTDYLNQPNTLQQGNYMPKSGRYQFNDDPTNPITLVPVNPNDPNGPTEAIKVYDAPFYGMQARRLAVQGIVNGKVTDHLVADPPVGFSVNNIKEYQFSFDEVIREGGAVGLNQTKRTPDQTITGFFWAYDGSNLIGTPPRHYNQILRTIAWSKKPAGATDEATNAEFARLFALVNVASADAAIQAWLEKYRFSFWRPLSAVRQDGLYGNSMADAFFLTLSSPETNSNQIPTKPPFPSYPSGHATFGGAIFQIMRLYYKRRDDLSFMPDEPDNISFTIGSDELNGISRDLRQSYIPDKPITEQEGTVRTFVTRTFNSLWEAMFDNALSRVFLGVHWNFDAFSPTDVLDSTIIKSDGTTDYKKPIDIRYNTLGPRGDRPGMFPVGGVPLGIGIANDIFQGNLKATPASKQTPFNSSTGEPAPAPDIVEGSDGQVHVIPSPVAKFANGDSNGMPNGEVGAAASGHTTSPLHDTDGQAPITAA